MEDGFIKKHQHSIQKETSDAGELNGNPCRS